MTVALDSAGKGKVELPKFKKSGKVKVTVKYAGDAATPALLEEKAKFRVVE